ncbi:MAG: Histidine ammonia-lyase [Candidatus Gottesmanbacteria bacterium GW2011_GWA1_34_13]|uniref:Histidine ammonia-lyase n=1 Tax=Candidatus Gottesmanbacteria bacterium GW2011_GWA1_34_13 TaxID=1618434 RepID=A0A0G0ASJ3_9BACT|nr:MAG: Histidine ammonia-lyase [Candidatus Gottesmanbacteria bacterium GW2011_GWA1_34_13]
MKNVDYLQKSLVEINRNLSMKKPNVILTGKDLTIQDILSVAIRKTKVLFTDDPRILNKMNASYGQMIEQIEKGIPIYGCNTGYGARASQILNKGTLEKRLEISKLISESIVHTDIGVGPVLSKEIVRAAILIRINMLVNGVSAVRIQDLDIFRKTLNKNITPVVNVYGGLGASGDLPQNSRVLSAMRQLSGVKVYFEDDKIGEAKQILTRNGIPRLLLEPKAGLGLVNGDNFSTAAATLIVNELIEFILISDVLGALVVEVLRGSNRSFHPFLSAIRPHPCQLELSNLYLYLLKGSKLAYQELKGHSIRPNGIKIQDAYSLRCIIQSEGLNRELIKWALQTITINANSVSDNPLWVSPEFVTEGEKPWQWVSGGNFFAGHMGEVIDTMRKIITRLIKRNDRHLHRMVCPHENNGLTANLSDKQALSMCAFKGIQLQSGMFDVYSMLLAMPVTTMFGIHEEANQDITPHAMTSAILAWENLKLLKYSLAMNLLAVMQAVDLRGGPELLSPRTRPLYHFIRLKSKYVTRERPLNNDIEVLAKTIENGEMIKILREKVLQDL